MITIVGTEVKDEGKQKLVIVDTDIGTDVDDALALLLLLHLPAVDVQLLGITTVNSKQQMNKL